MISFLMPAYKSAFIKQAIESIVNQTSNDWELVVVDDASPEDLESVIAPYCREYENVRYYRNAVNIGGTDLVKQWNHCLGYAEGDWIVMAGDDDVYAPTFCEEMQRLSEKYTHVDLIRSRVEQIDEHGKHLWDDGSPAEFTDKYEYLHDWLTAKIFTCIGNYAFRRDKLISLGGFLDFPCAFGSDIATPILLSQNGVANTSEMLFKFRQSSNHLSADTSRFKEKLQGITQLSRWIENLRYNIPETDNCHFEDVYNSHYLHDKCVYDYFNLVIQYLPLGKLWYLRYCEGASFVDKIVMILRWMKRRLF